MTANDFLFSTPLRFGLCPTLTVTGIWMRRSLLWYVNDSTTVTHIPEHTCTHTHTPILFIPLTPSLSSLCPALCVPQAMKLTQLCQQGENIPFQLPPSLVPPSKAAHLGLQPPATTNSHPPSTAVKSVSPPRGSGQTGLYVNIWGSWSQGTLLRLVSFNGTFP